MQLTETHLFERVSKSTVCTSKKKKQQTCLRCGEDHRADQCKVTDENVKCCNCKGKDLATSKEPEKRAKKLIN